VSKRSEKQLTVDPLVIRKSPENIDEFRRSSVVVKRRSHNEHVARVTVSSDCRVQ